MDMDSKAGAIASATIYVSGKVQGVYFRGFTREKASNLGLDGFVQNLSDSRVMLVVQGNVADIKTLIDFLHIGPKHSIVENVDVQWSDFLNSDIHSGFIIRR
jgi:acylphosphatase